MKRQVSLWAVVAVVAAVPATRADAQPARDERQVLVALHVMGAAMSAMTVRRADVDVDLSASSPSDPEELAINGGRNGKA